jgi:hypothetical protein
MRSLSLSMRCSSSCCACCVIAAWAAAPAASSLRLHRAHDLALALEVRVLDEDLVGDLDPGLAHGERLVELAVHDRVLVRRRGDHHLVLAERQIVGDAPGRLVVAD